MTNISLSGKSIVTESTTDIHVDLFDPPVIDILSKLKEMASKDGFVFRYMKDYANFLLKRSPYHKLIDIKSGSKYSVVLISEIKTISVFGFLFDLDIIYDNERERISNAEIKEIFNTINRNTFTLYDIAYFLSSRREDIERMYVHSYYTSIFVSYIRCLITTPNNFSHLGYIVYVDKNDYEDYNFSPLDINEAKNVIFTIIDKVGENWIYKINDLSKLSSEIDSKYKLEKNSFSLDNQIRIENAITELFGKE